MRAIRSKLNDYTVSRVTSVITGNPFLCIKRNMFLQLRHIYNIPSHIESSFPTLCMKTKLNTDTGADGR